MTKCEGGAILLDFRHSLLGFLWSFVIRHSSFFCFLLYLASTGFAMTAGLQLEILPKAAGETLQPASLRYQTSANETFSVTRVSYLLSDFALQKPDGSWLEFSNSVAWFDFEQNRNAWRVGNIPGGTFQAIRFSVGLNTNLNHADISKFAAGHALNPTVNGLYWSWQGGCIFMALEGLWRQSSGDLSGWAYHFARDTNVTRITLAAPLLITNETQLNLDFDITTLLNAPRPLSFTRDGSSTHSRDGDPISDSLKRNLPGAFRVRKISSFNDSEFAAANPKPLFLPEKYTPWPFEMSAFFPMPDLPPDNPLTVGRVQLGRDLFFDKHLSVNNEQSCSDCHIPRKGFTDGRAQARGAEGMIGPRKTMPLFNLAWKRQFFWDGRAPTLRAQVFEPIQNPIEMHESLSNVVQKLKREKAYPVLFEAAFGSPEITSQKLALALENFLFTLTSCDSKFDRVLRGEQKFTADEERGFELFSTEYDPRRGQFGADCFHCHGGPLFQSQSFANNGLDSTDIGYAKVTGKESDKGRFSVPSLRNVALTAPYMHDGRFKTLEEAVEHYATGVKRSASLDPNLAKHPNGGVPLTQNDKKALVSFLNTLTDPKLVSSE